MIFEDVINSRRSIRYYTDQEIDGDTLESILEAGMRAPVSRKKYGDILFTVVKRSQYKEAINSMFDGPSPFYQAKVLILISSKPDAAPHVTDFNVACIVENMLLSATDSGLGSIFLSKFLLDKQDEIRDLFSIPEEYDTYAAVGIGYEEKSGTGTDYMVRRDNNVAVTYY